ncbi:MAG: hypothetical protein Q9163_000183 [Psora crenata]
MAGLSDPVSAGDQVCGAYMRRIKDDCKKAAKQPYDWIIIMGGTNDLGWGKPPAVIYENLTKVWRVALDSGAKVLALNVIEAAGSSQGMVRKRKDLNDMIAKHEEDRL